MEYSYNKIEDRFAAMISFLKHLSGKVEMIADEIDNENLKDAMRTFAVESIQYANELKSEMKHLNIVKSIDDFEIFIDDIIEPKCITVPQQNGEEILTFCDRCEAFFHRMYNDFLNDILSSISLKNIVSYQLMGIKSAIMRIKTLNTLRFHH
jgi:hypothetical protein